MKTVGWSAPVWVSPAPSPQDCVSSAIEIPLRAARVLKLVDEDVVVARLEAIAALGELLHLAEQRARVQQEIREIEDGVGVERPPVLGLGHLEHAPHAARDEHVEVAAIRGMRIHDRRRVREDEVTVHLPIGRRREIVLLVEQHLRARQAVLRQEVLARSTERGVHVSRVEFPLALLLGPPEGGPCIHTLLQRGELPAQDQKRGLERSGFEKAIESAPHRREHVEERRRATPGGGQQREIAGADRKKPRQGRRSGDASIEQRGQPGSCASIAQLREDQGHVRVFAGEAAAHAERTVEGLADETRHLGLVGHRESGVEVGLEGKLAKQREAERVNRADGHIGRAIAQLTPAFARELAAACRVAQGGHDALAHFRRRLAREGQREDLSGIDAGAQQVDVAIDENPRLAGAGRCLERDVEPGIHGPFASGTVAGVDPRLDGLGRLPRRSCALARGEGGSSSNGSRKLVTVHVVLPADGHEGAPRADDRIVRARRKLASLDPVDHREESLACC